MIRKLLIVLLGWMPYYLAAETVTLYRSETASVRILFGVEKLETALTSVGYVVKKEIVGLNNVKKRWPSKSGHSQLLIAETGDPAMTACVQRCKLTMPQQTHKEGYQICSTGQTIVLRGVDATGTLYACMELCDRIKQTGHLPAGLNVSDQPDMVLRGACVGLQKPYYLPGRTVYEYPYTTEIFPWFYDKAMWVKYLDMLLENRMNSLYLWNGHPFASLVKLKDYPFAMEVSEADFRKNEDIFRFLTEEADKRGIWVIQMFYNILVSKPFAEHYGIKTQDRNRPITPLLADYTRKSISAFIEKYPNVGLLVCLGEAMNTYEDDVAWFTKTIIPGVQDGLKALGKTEEVPIILRAHDTNCQMVMDSALLLYKNLYTMNKYTGESLVTYTPGGPWSKIHKDLSELGSTHISNVHILANLEPFRWSAPGFIRKCVNAMHTVQGANGLHLYPQASYWDWPYTADKVQPRLYQTDRDWMWYKAWGRYAWKVDRQPDEEKAYWAGQLAVNYGCGDQSRLILEAYEEMGEIAPMLTRKFAITEGNRQTFLLGSFMSQLINPDRWNCFPDFINSCDPGGERLADYVSKEWMGASHSDNNPVAVIQAAVAHGDAAVKAIDQVTSVTANQAEFTRLKNDVHCMAAFARSFSDKVMAATLVMRFPYSNELTDLEKALPYLRKSLDEYKELVLLTNDSYLYANSMQTKQRRIPIGGDEGKNKTWADLLPLYEAELSSFETNLEKLKCGRSGQLAEPAGRPLNAEDVTLSDTSLKLVTLKDAPYAFADRESPVVQVAEELQHLKGIRWHYADQQTKPTEIRFSCNKPVSVLVGYFRTVQVNYLAPSRLETDASANDYGQAEARLSNALAITGQPPVDIHTFTFPAGNHVLTLPKGAVLVLGFTDGTQPVPVRDAGLSDKKSIDWLFY